MWTHHNKKQEKRLKIAIAVLAVIVIFLLLLLKSCDGNATSSFENVNQSATEEKALDFIPAVEKGRINIPGFTGIYLKPGQVNQSVNFYNPESNNCYFILSLYLSNNTLIWESDYIAPGEKVTDITLLHELDKGLYKNCVLQYRCFTLDDKTELNGSTQTLEINTN